MRRLRCLVLGLVLLHAIALGAGLFAPYDPLTQYRDFALAPPTRIHLIDAAGRWYVWPFVYTWTRDSVTGRYAEDTSHRYPVRLLTRRADGDGSRRLVGVRPPAHLFLLGTDEYGRDQFSRLLHGARVSLTAGLAATLITVTVGLLLGGVAGFLGGTVDRLIMRLAELCLALPWLYLLLAVRSVLPLDLPSEHALVLIVGLIALVGWSRPAALVRDVVRVTRTRDFVMAARGLGASNVYLLRRHLLPSASGAVVTQMALLVPQFILAEATLSFLGLGIAEPTPSWGNMLAAAQQYHVLVSHWWMLAPGIALVPVCMLYHVLADAAHEWSGVREI